MHALKVRAAELRRDQSAIMRELLDNFLRETEGRRA
jgi:plasmid stability protein